MKRRDFLGTVLVGGAGLAGLGAVNVASAERLAGAAGKSTDDSKIRERRQIDFDWRFQLGDARGAEAAAFDDAGWRLLDLPHDWSVEGKIEESNPASWHGAYLPGGIGWYRKKIAWDDSWNGRHVFVDFDGVYMNSDVWINGRHLGRRPYGYTTFRHELTPHLRKNGDNVIAVRVDNSKQPSGRWYTGCGIYRHVWLNVVNPVHVDHWGTFVTTPKITKDAARVNVKTRLVNSGGAPAGVTVEQIIRDRSGRVVARARNPATAAGGGNNTELSQDLEVAAPALWSPEAPNLYRVETLVRCDEGRGDTGAILDQCFTPLGIRTLEFGPEFGFRLNGARTMIKGVCNHHDAGGALGAAVPDDVLWHRLRQLKETGCNAIRTAHNPHAPELAAFCDELGLMVLDEAFDGWQQPKSKAPFDYGNYFQEWWDKDLGDFVRRDRNHPSVIAWSIGNEVPGFTAAWQEKLVKLIRALDPTRPITQGRGSKSDALDIYGFNGEAESRGVFEEYHKKNPRRVLLGTEIPHTRQTRGVYLTAGRHLNTDGGSRKNKYDVAILAEPEIFTGTPKAYSSSFDNNFFSIGVRDQFRLQNQKIPSLIGSFRWTGFDYLGEANDGWPLRSKDKGVFDLAGLPKDHYFLYQSLWTTKPMVHLLPHWTHPGKEGVKIPVVAYTNCRSVELFLNGKSLGEQAMPAELQIVWQVPYQPGELRAVAKNEHGVPMAETTRKTAGPAAAVDVAATKTHFHPNRQDAAIVEVTIVDAGGTMLPDADELVTFGIEGPGKLIGVENGDVLDLAPTKFVNTRKVFKGKCVGVVQATDRAGEIKITASAGNLKAGTVRIIAAV